MTCRIPGCTTKNYDKRGLRTFCAPSPSILKKWQETIKRNTGLERFYEGDRICIQHFTEDSIERTRTEYLRGGLSRVVLMKRPDLRFGAIPTIFPKYSARKQQQLQYAVKLETPEILEKHKELVEETKKRTNKLKRKFAEDMGVNFENKLNTENENSKYLHGTNNSTNSIYNISEDISNEEQDNSMHRPNSVNATNIMEENFFETVLDGNENNWRCRDETDDVMKRNKQKKLRHQYKAVVNSKNNDGNVSENASNTEERKQRYLYKRIVGTKTHENISPYIIKVWTPISP